MKPHYLFNLARLCGGVTLALLAPTIQAQQAIAIHSFAAFTNFSQTNYDGSGPTAGLLLVGTNLYGTAVSGGAYSQGTLFAISTNGVGFTNLHNFGKPLPVDAKKPRCNLVRVGNRVYGTLSEGGTTDSGGIFGINLDGTGYSNFYTFNVVVLDTTIFASTNKDGAFPWAGLAAAGNMLYGVTVSGGKFGSGTIFGMRTNGTGFTNLHNFARTPISSGTNNEGAAPYSALILSGGILYGMASHGGTNTYGTVFGISTNGTGFTNLHNFVLDSDGGQPVDGSLLLADNVLYGAAYFGGPFGTGTIFKLNTDGTGFTVLHPFPAQPPPPGTNTDGAAPHATLILSGATLVGTCTGGGMNGTGTIFTLKTNGNDFAVIYHFSANNTSNLDGAYPRPGVVLADNTLYGTAEDGGTNGRGSVYSFPLTVPPPLAIARNGANALVSWPTAAVGFDLQSCNNLLAANWTNTTGNLAVVNTNFVFTNFLTGPSTFFRLRR